MSIPDPVKSGSDSVLKFAPNQTVPTISAKADKTLNDAFSGLLGSPPEPTGQRPFPKNSRQVAIDLAEAMIEAGIRTPEGMAAFLDGMFAKNARSLSQSLWSSFAIVELSLVSAPPDWAAIYATLDAVERELNHPDTVAELALKACADLVGASPQPAQTTVISMEEVLIDWPSDEADSDASPQMTCDEDGDDEEDFDDPDEDEDEDAGSEADIALWAKGLRGQIETITCLLDATLKREGINPDHIDAIKTIRSELARIIQGKMPSNCWELSSTLSQGMDDGSSRGTRTYTLSMQDGGFRMACRGTERQKGEGSESWTGATFDYRLHRSNSESGQLYEFMGEFKHAVSNSDYVLSVSLNDESIGELPHPALNDSEGEVWTKQTILKVVGELQRMTHTLSGDDSGLETTWDEICAQQQIEESVCWDVYELTIRTLIEGTVGKLPREELAAVWLLTGEGEEWAAEKETDGEEPFPNEDDVVNFLYGRLISVSYDYLNARIISYRDRQYRNDDVS